MFKNYDWYISAAILYFFIAILLIQYSFLQIDSTRNEIRNGEVGIV